MKPTVVIYDCKERPPIETPDGALRIDVTIAANKLTPGVDTRQSEMALWLQEEIASYHESNNVFLKFADQHPDRLSAADLNQLLIRIRGKGWGKWKDPKGTIQGLELTTADFIDQKTLVARYVDHVTLLKWYVTFRKRRLKQCIRYAEEPDQTIRSFQSMIEKITEETVASVPKAEALATTAKNMITESERRPDQITTLLQRTLDAKDALYAAMADLGDTVHKFKETTDAYSRDLHAFKASVIHDISTAKNEMADVRKFFLEKEHVTEIDRLKEFIALCEKLRALKNDGTLDAIASTILKLEGV